MRIGCNTMLFVGFDLDTAFKNIALAGYEGVELLFDPYALLKEAAYSADYRDPSRGAYKGANMQAEHIINQALIPERREQIVNGVKAAAERYSLSLYAIECHHEIKTMSAAFSLAKDIGVRIIATFSSGISDDEESTKKTIADLQGLAHEAEKLELKLAVKPHQNFAIYNTDTLLRLLREVGSSALGVNFDPNQLFRAGDDVVEAIVKLKEHIVHCHFRDCEGRGSRGAPEAQVAGHGKIDIPHVLKSLRDINYKGFLTFHCAGAGFYDLPRVVGLLAEHRGYVFRCLQELGLTSIPVI